MVAKEHTHTVKPEAVNGTVIAVAVHSTFQKMTAERAVDVAN